MRTTMRLCNLPLVALLAGCVAPAVRDFAAYKLETRPVEYDLGFSNATVDDITRRWEPLPLDAAEKARVEARRAQINDLLYREPNGRFEIRSLAISNHSIRSGRSSRQSLTS